MAEVLTTASGTMQHLANEVRQGRLPTIMSITRKDDTVSIEFKSAEYQEAEDAYAKQSAKVEKLSNKLDAAEDKLDELGIRKIQLMKRDSTLH